MRGERMREERMRGKRGKEKGNKGVHNYDDGNTVTCMNNMYSTCTYTVHSKYKPITQY